MARKRTKAVPSERVFRQLGKRGSFRIEDETSVELELYAKVGMYGSKKKIMEEALNGWFSKNPMKPEIRKAAIVLLEELCGND